MDDRRDDWRHGVDENLVSLNTAQRVTDSQTDELELRYEAVDKILRGDPENKEDGIIAEIHSMEIMVNDLRAELFRIKQSFREEDHERREDRRLSWGNLTKIVIAIITSGAVGLFWRDIRAFFTQKSADPLQVMIEQAKHPKARHRHAVIRQPLPPAEEPEP